jgi:hypothetical protein
MASLIRPAVLENYMNTISTGRKKKTKNKQKQKQSQPWFKKTKHMLVVQN